MNKGLTLTMIFQANSLNYGEGMGNISELKKFSRGNGQMYTFASRQSLRYDIVRLGHELFNWNLQTVSNDEGTIQFKKDATIEDSEEMDLFGYMKTVKGKSALTREAVVRVTPAISLEPYKSDMDFLNNMGMAQRIGESNNLANIEQHHSLYTYTVTIDLSKIGEDGPVSLSPDEKSNRVTQLLTILNLLNRRIRGRQENLSPLFIIGGIYAVCNPFFLGRIQLRPEHTGFELDTSLLQDGLEKKFFVHEIKHHTHIGMASGVFNNEEDLSGMLPSKQVHSVQGMFDYLIDKVKSYYLVDEYEGTTN
ncbi:type I-B CRISPR-associated protein Cas7/Cst2/DevR [Laceyella tengchongensis]